MQVEYDDKYWMAIFKKLGAEAIKKQEAIDADRKSKKTITNQQSIFTANSDASTTEDNACSRVMRTSSDELTPEMEQKRKKVESIIATIEERKPKMMYPDWDMSSDKGYQDFMEFMENTKIDIAQHCNELRKKGLSDEEISRDIRSHQIRQVDLVARYLREKFDEDPTLRIKMQENFRKLPSQAQAALFKEAIMDGRKLNQDEVYRMFANLLSDSTSDGVRIYALSAYKIEHPDASGDVDFIAKALDANETLLNLSFKFMSAENQVSSADYFVKQGSDEALCDFGSVVHHTCEDAIPEVSETIVSSDRVKENEEFQVAVSKNIHSWDKNSRKDVYEKFYSSSTFGSKARSVMISDIKCFDDAKLQLHLANFTNASKMSDEQNRATLATQIKYFDKSIQAQFAETFVNTKENQTEAVTKVFANEIQNLQVDDKSKAELLDLAKQTGKISDEVVNKIETEIKTGMLVEQTPENLQKKAQDELRRIVLAATGGNVELTNMVVDGQLSANGASLSVFVDLLAKGTITPELVIASGHKSSLTRNFVALSKHSQEKVFSMLSSEEISEMWEKGKIPARFEDRVMAKLSGNMNTKVANQLARKSSFSELVKFAKSSDTQKHQDIFKKAIQNRFSEYITDKDIMGGGLIA